MYFALAHDADHATALAGQAFERDCRAFNGLKLLQSPERGADDGLKRPTTIGPGRRRKREAGVALLVSLFALMLICVVGVALIMASGTDVALTGNYSAATIAYYAALAGLEEGRGRLLANSPNNSNVALALGLPAGSLPGLGQVWYITNPAPAETVTPWNLGSTYADTEYFQEFGVNPPTSAPALGSTGSISAQPPLAGPIYKWVRINAITATSIATTGVSVNGSPPQGPQNTPLLYANGYLYNDPVAAGPSATQAVEITALAAMQMPNGTLTQQMVQYVVAPVNFNLNFPAALLLDGNGVVFNGPVASPGPLAISGTDSLNVGVCHSGTQVLPGIGYSNGPPATMANASGSNLPSADVTTSLPPNLQSVSKLDTFVQSVQQNADFAYSGPQNGAVLPPTSVMSAATPVNIAVDGDLDLSAWSGTGYGVLLVQGTLKLGPNANWDGEVLVVGVGTVDATAGAGQINGAVLVAQTRSAVDGPLLGNFGPSSWTQTVNGPGIAYSSCWLSVVQKIYSYKVLSFREIPLS
jgi:hypothetical protein